MLGAIGRTVSRLMRVRYGPLALPPGLKRGQLRELSPDAVADLVAVVEGASPEPHLTALAKGAEAV